MLSICIPIYNRDCIALVNELLHQRSDCAIEIEIIAIDDASNDFYKKLNEPLTKIDKVKYMELATNIGRSAIRNLLTENSTYAYILFLDCDILPAKKDFLLLYCEYISKENQVIVGGRQYRKEDCTPQTKLHYHYGSVREAKAADWRNLKPYDAFVTGNFCIKKSIVQKIKFEDTLTEYGHEDTLFGVELKKNGIEVLHIDNPVIHIGVESNQVFLEKQVKAVTNLAFLISQGYDLGSVSLYAFYLKLARLHVLSLFIFCLSPFKSIFKKALSTGNINALFLFDIYRLLEFSNVMKIVTKKKIK